MAIRSLNGVGIHVVEDPVRLAAGWLIHTASEPGNVALSGGSLGRAYELAAVSYTHLTLPTTERV